MRYCTIICSYNSASLTERVYEELLKNKKHDIFILENSSTEEQMFKKGDIIDLGRANIGFGGMRDFIFKEQKFRQYDFVGIFNNDVFDIPSNYIEEIEKHFTSDVGMVSSATTKQGSGWEHMWQMRKSGARDVSHVEDFACYFNTKLFDKFCEFIPSEIFGAQDIVSSGLYQKYGYRTIVVDDIVIKHMLAGAREMAGVKIEYLKRFPEKLVAWLEQHKEIHDIYYEYIKKISKPIAVIIPNYNHNHLLRRAIESVLRQKILCDIIVVDDCSEINPYESIKDLPIRFFRHDKNRGLSASRNTGISNTKSKWILPLDADDELLEGALNELFNQKDADILHGNLIWRDGNFQMKPGQKEPTYEMFLGNNQIFGCSLYKRDFWIKAGGYWEEPRECYEDWDFWGRCAKVGAKFKYVDKDIYLYGGNNEGMCARLGKDRERNANLVINHIKDFKEI